MADKDPQKEYEEELEYYEKTHKADVDATEKIERQKKIDANIKAVQERQAEEAEREAYEKERAKNLRIAGAKKRYAADLEEDEDKHPMITIENLKKGKFNKPVKEAAERVITSFDKGISSVTEKITGERGGKEGIHPLGSGKKSKSVGSMAKPKQSRSVGGGFKAPAITGNLGRSPFGGTLSFGRGSSGSAPLSFKSPFNRPAAPKETGKPQHSGPGGAYDLGLNFGSMPFGRSRKK